MRLKKGFILHNIEDEYMAVATGEAARGFNGLIRNNGSADFIYRMLQSDTTEEAIVHAMCEHYDAPEEVIASDVRELLEKIKEAGFLDE